MLKKRRKAEVNYRPLEIRTVILELNWVSAYVTEFFEHDLAPKVKGWPFSQSEDFIGLSWGSNAVGWHIRRVAAFSRKLYLPGFCTGWDIPLAPVQTGIFLKSKRKHSVRHRNAAEDNTEGISTSWNSNLALHVVIAITGLSKRRLGKNAGVIAITWLVYLNPKHKASIFIKNLHSLGTSGWKLGLQGLWWRTENFALNSTKYSKSSSSCL